MLGSVRTFTVPQPVPGAAPHVDDMISRECGVDVLFVPASLCVLGTHRDWETPG